MDPITYGLVTFGLLLALLFLGVPIAYALGATVLLLTLVIGPVSDALYVALTMFEALDSFELLAIPMFVLMGAVIAASPAGSDIYRALHRLLPFPGGLGVSTVGGCALFSALSGSSPATVAAIGSSGVPEMLERGYPPRLATGIIVGGGTLGILIPPSIVLLIYGIVTEVSIGKLFLAGIVPGLVIVVLFSLYITWAMRRAQRLVGAVAPDPASTTSLLRVVPFLLLVTGVMVALYGGWATPSEVAAMAAVAAILLVATIYRMWDWTAWRSLLMKSARETSFIMLVAAFSYYLNQYLAFQGTLEMVTQALLVISENRWVTLFLLSLVMLFMGCFLPPFAIVVIVAPMFLPFVHSVGFDPIWFGILVTINMEMGLITPPIGINLFVVKSIVPHVSLNDIMAGSLPFLLLLAVASLLLCFVPGLALWLPNALL
jgi:tripartite ATP-independent transporter DctM subunit